MLFSASSISYHDFRSSVSAGSSSCVNVLGWPYRTRAYSFAEIAGLDVVRGSKIDERDPMPVISLKNGTMLPLGTFTLNRFQISDSGSD